MLCTLKIKNVALIKELNIEFFNGLNILSGETGAGKSIIIDSLGFVLGGKADKNMIRSGEDKCEVFATFELSQDDTALAVLENMGIEKDTTVIIHRTLDTFGKSKCFINGENASLSMIKSLTQTICDIHGQSEHHSLMNVSMQLELLDKFGGNDIFIALNEYKKTYSEYKDTIKQLNSFGGNDGDRERLVDMLKYQINEIENADIKKDELVQLQSKRSKLLNLDKLLKALNTAISCISLGDNNLADQTSLALHELNYASQFDEKVSPQARRLDSLKYEIDDISEELKSILSGYDVEESNENLINKIDDRIDVIKNIYKKYGGSHDSAISFHEKAVSNLDKLLRSDKIIEELTIKRDGLEKRLNQQSEELTDQRKKAAEKFKDSIKTQFVDLGLKNADFDCVFNKSERFSNNGTDEMQFYMSANLGQAMKPLDKVISGGEASRFMLALKTITSDIDRIPLMVFDEIDTGISGEIAQTVAIKFAKISSRHQLLAITHLPQIAAVGDNNFLIEKVSTDNTTITNVKILDLVDKQKEVARLAGGSNIGEHGILHAKELIEWSNDQKKLLRRNLNDK